MGKAILMCDEISEAENERWMQARALGRREFAALGASASVAMMMPGAAMAAKGASQTAVTATAVSIPMADGTADAYFVHPAKGRHAAVILWPDIAGLREAYQVMGTRLAQAGYAVLVVNQYYRSAKAPILNSLAEWRTEEGQTRLKPMLDLLFQPLLGDLRSSSEKNDPVHLRYETQRVDVRPEEIRPELPQ